MGLVLEFPDVSHYQTGLSLTGAVAAVAKATQGVSNVDPAFAGFRRQAAALAIPFSGYHWIDTSDPVAQARWYFAHAAGAPCMWDAEADGATVPRILVATAALEAEGGHAWGAYLPRWWWQGHIGSPDLRPLVAAGLALVSSDYRTTPPNAGWAPYGGVTPTAWQYTDKQRFNGVACDFNRYQGTAGQLAALFTAATVPGPKEDDMPIFVHCKENGGYYSYPVPKWYLSEGAVNAGLAAYGMTRAQVVEFATLDAVRDALGPIPGADIPTDKHGNAIPTAAVGGGGGLVALKVALTGTASPA
jgi:hypothetical protein